MTALWLIMKTIEATVERTQPMILQIIHPIILVLRVHLQFLVKSYLSSWYVPFSSSSNSPALLFIYPLDSIDIIIK